MADMANTEKRSINNWIFWLAIFAIFCYFIHLTKSILLPFVVGIIIAYFFNPLVKKLTNHKVNRILASAIVLGMLMLVLVPTIIMIVGVINDQLTNFINKLPELVNILEIKLTPILGELKEKFPNFNPQNIKEYLRNNASNAVKILTTILKNVVTGGFAFLSVISLLIISPIVAFHMLKDWEKFTAKIYGLIPLKHKEEITTIIKNIDTAISGFIRGQFTVCFILGLIYSAGLSIVGLQLGFVVGFVTGIISFVPFIGGLTGFITAMVIAFIQFDSPGPILGVVMVFVVGQFLEGNFLTPKLVGDSVGLHPVWIMFAVLAGGTLLGVLGVMIAVPVAAITGVLIRHFTDKYKSSSIYKK